MLEPFYFYVACGKNQMPCNATCKPDHLKCDFKTDCPNKRDESSCILKRRNHLFLRKCSLVSQNFCRIVINSMGILTSKPGYPYQSREECINYQCKPNEYKCVLEGYCISVEQICDKINHCLHGDDEMNCENYILKGFFKCRREEKFIDDNKLCNGIVDCHYGSDEIYCLKKNLDCNQTQSPCFYPFKHLKYIKKCIFTRNHKSEIKSIELYKIKSLFIKGNVLFRKFSTVELILLRIEDNDELSHWNIDVIRNLINLQVFNSNTYDMNIFKNSQNLFLLQTLNLTKSNLQSFNFLNKLNCSNLITLYISKSEITVILEKHMMYLNNLQYFHLESTNIKFIEKNSFNSFLSIEKIVLESSYFPIENSTVYMKDVQNLKYLNTEQFQLCCIANEFLTDIISCAPEKAVFITCHNILQKNFLKILFWIAAIFGILSNFFSFIFFTSLNRKKQLKIYLSCLSFGDFLSSIYFLFISIVDVFYANNEYIINEEIWRMSSKCTILGITMSFSMLFSLLIILLMTIEKYEAITSPFKIPFTTKYSLHLSLSLFLLCIIIGIFPILPYRVRLDPQFFCNFISTIDFSFRIFIQNRLYVLNLIFLVQKKKDGYFHF